MTTKRFLAVAAAATLLFAACGDDDDSAGGDDATTTTAGDGGGDDGGESAEGSEEYCALAEEMASQDSFPTAEQLERYQELAPEEIADAVAVAAPPLIESADDPLAQFATFAEDDIEQAMLCRKLAEERFNAVVTDGGLFDPVDDPTVLLTTA